MAAVCTSFGWLAGVSSIHFSTGSRIKIQSPGLHTKHCHLPSQPACASFLSYLFLTSWDRFAVQSVLLNDRTREDQHLFVPINLSGTVPLSKSQWLGRCKRSRTFYPTKIRDQQKCYWLAEVCAWWNWKPWAQASQLPHQNLEVYAATSWGESGRDFSCSPPLAVRQCAQWTLLQTKRQSEEKQWLSKV